jgi:acyl dehydratase
MTPREVNFADIKSLIGQDLGESQWHTVTQPDINTFADVTHDHQWIHIDADRAKKESPYKTTIAHGYYTLSLVPHLMSQVWRVKGVKMGVNYGLNKLRFPSPVPVGARVRAKGKLLNVEDVKGGAQVTVEVTIEVEGSEKPAAVIETLSRYYN